MSNDSKQLKFDFDNITNGPELTKNNSFYSLEIFQVRNFYGIKEIDLELPTNAPWIFLTGENGFGKTSILQALSIGLSNINDRKIYEAIKPLEDDCLITVKINGKERIVSGSPESVIDLSKDEYRIMGYGPARTSMGSDRNTKIYAPATGLFEPGTILKNIESEGLSRWKFIDEHTEKYNETVKLFKKLMPNLHDVEVDDDSNVWYIEKDDDGNPLHRVNFNGLGSGYRNIISMVGDIILGLNSPRKKHEVIDLRVEMKAVILIDEFELYLHPKLQKELPSILSSLFPNVQFIASTHSPIPLLGAPEGSVFLKVNRTIEDGIKVERLEKLEKEIRYLLPNTILTSDIFDFDIFEQMSEEQFNAVHLENDYKKIDENKEITERLKNLDKSIFPNNLFDKE